MHVRNRILFLKNGLISFGEDLVFEVVGFTQIIFRFAEDIMILQNGKTSIFLMSKRPLSGATKHVVPKNGSFIASTLPSIFKNKNKSMIHNILSFC